MKQAIRQFVCEENKKYKFMLGRTIASSLTGFICGGIVVSIIWYLAIYIR